MMARLGSCSSSTHEVKRGPSMASILLFCVLLFQVGSQPAPRPAIENDRVVVWDGRDSAPVQPLDAVIVFLSGDAIFVPKGTTSKISGRFIVINLKDHPVPPMANTSGYPLAFPREGVKKLLENNRVIVWDYTWTPGKPTVMHFHDKQVVVVYMASGKLKSTTPDGKSEVNTISFGLTKFNEPNRSHSEELVDGTARAVIVE